MLPLYTSKYASKLRLQGQKRGGGGRGWRSGGGVVGGGVVGGGVVGGGGRRGRSGVAVERGGGWRRVLEIYEPEFDFPWPTTFVFRSTIFSLFGWCGGPTW